MADGALPIGSRDVYASELSVWVTDGLTKLEGVMQVFLICLRADPAEHGQAFVEVADGLRVVHVRSAFRRRGKDSAARSVDLKVENDHAHIRVGRVGVDIELQLFGLGDGDRAKSCVAGR